MNTKPKREIEWKGKTQGLWAWGRELGISGTVLQNRLNSGWSVERAFTEPVNKKRLPYVSKRISHPDYAPPVVPSTTLPAKQATPTTPHESPTTAAPASRTNRQRRLRRRPDPPFLANLRRWLAELDVIDAQGVALQTKRAEIVKAITIACTGHE
jgi:hypothetical protein